jgi:Bacterial lectin/Glycogen recognition site of AMP-activated protein kinase
MGSLLKYGLCLLLCFNLCGAALGFVVTFKVDMSQQNVSPNGIHLAGNFQGWNPSATLMTPIGGGVYCVVLDLPAGNYQFKFINGNAWGMDETVPNSCGVDDGMGIFNREIIVGSSDIILPAVCFGQCSFCNQNIYVTNGNAAFLGGDCYQITPDLNWQNGTVWNSNQIDLLEDFSMQFFLNLGSSDGGADGVVFVLQRIGTSAIGVGGGGMGYSSFGTSLGIEFDTFQNPEYNDPSYDHAAIEKNGDVDHITANLLAGPVQMSPLNINTEDGLDHVVQIVWNATTTTIQLYFDCQLILQTNIDIMNSIFGGENMVYWGFTGATGLNSNLQKLCIQPNAVVAGNIPICPGGSALLQAGASSTNVYNWTPVSWLDNPAIANPTAFPDTTTTYSVSTLGLCGALTTTQVTVEVLENDPACSVLPVSLILFEVIPLEDFLLLKWATYSEIQNDYFIIEESSDGIHFREVATTPGAGNSNDLRYYEFELKRLSHDRYYRLGQFDWNGHQEVISSVVYVEGNNIGGPDMRWSNAFSTLYLSGCDPQQQYQVELFNANGCRLLSHKLNALTDYQMAVNLKNGFYVACCFDSNGQLKGILRFIMNN